MKTSSIIILVVIAAAIGALLMYSVDFSTYDTIGSAKEKQGQYVHLIAKLDKSKPIQYDALKDPNYLSFYAVDSRIFLVVEPDQEQLQRIGVSILAI